MIDEQERRRRERFLLFKLHAPTQALNDALREANEQNIPVYVRVHEANGMTGQTIVETSLCALLPDEPETHTQTA